MDDLQDRVITGHQPRRSRVECWLSEDEYRWLRDMADAESRSISAILRAGFFALIEMMDRDLQFVEGIMAQPPEVLY